MFLKDIKRIRIGLCVCVLFFYETRFNIKLFTKSLILNLKYNILPLIKLYTRSLFYAVIIFVVTSK